MMTLIRCLGCDQILEVSADGEVDQCTCSNKTTLIYDAEVIKIGAEDFSKVAVFSESSRDFEQCSI